MGAMLRLVRNTYGDDDPIIDRYLAWLAAGAQAPSTIRQRGYVLRAFAAEHPLLTASTDDIIVYLAQPTRGPNGKRTVISALRKFYRWAVAVELVTASPMELVHQVREHRGLPRPVPDAIFARGLAEAHATCDVEGQRALMLGYYAGLRLSEIAAFHATARTAHGLVIIGKGDIERRIPIHDRLAPYLDGIEGWAFASWRKPGQHASTSYLHGKVCGLLGAPWTTHTLRHAFGTRVYRASNDLRAVQLLMGHADPMTTSRYVAVAGEQLDAAIRAVA